MVRAPAAVPLPVEPSLPDTFPGTPASPAAAQRGYRDDVDVLDGAFLGPYRLLARLGEGGMGVVHLALDADGRAVAVKALRPHLLDERGRERLLRELEALQRVRSPHVAELLDADLADDPPWLVMRYVQGRPLPERVSRHGPVHGDELHALVVGLGEAVAAVHGAGVVHRDVKPGNVLLADGSPVLVDFGLAHLVDDTRLTATGLLLGTPGYVAPESLRGQRVTPAADVHGWGATVAYAATGRAPYGTGPFEAVLARVVAGQHDLEGVPGWLLPLVTAALHPDPAARPTAAELLDALGTGEPLRRRAGTPQPQAWPEPGVTGRDAWPAPGSPPSHAVVTEHLPVREPVPLPSSALPPGAFPPGALSPGAFPPGALSPDALPPRLAGPGLPRPEAYALVPPGPPPPAPPRPATGTLLAVLVLLAGVAARVPVAAAVAGAALVVALRALDLGRRRVRSRRELHGIRPMDVPLAVLAAPWQLVRAMAALLLTLPQAATLGGAAALLTLAVGTRPSSAPAAPLSAVVLAALLALSFGPGTSGVRRGAAAVAAALLPGRAIRLLAAAVCVVTGVLVLLAAGSSPSSWPATSVPHVVHTVLDRLAGG
jgi:serine/threonine protein kinase